MATMRKSTMDRGAQIIALAVQLMAAGQARGWSDAIARALVRGAACN